MNKFTCLFLCLIAMTALTNCGFTPLYGKHTNTAAPDVGVEDHFALTTIAIIPNREGQFLRNKLIDNLHRRGAPSNPVYKLNVSAIQESITDLNITITADSTRAQIRLTTKMTLSDIKTGETLFDRNLRSITSYNILASEFATRVSETSAREDALTDLSKQIEAQLALYFKNH